MAKTRSAKPAPTPAATTESTAPNITLSSKAGPPPRLLVLPKRASPSARIFSLPNPRHGRPSRYLVCPDSGIYEFTKIAAPRTAPRSWLIETHTVPSDKEDQGSPAGKDGAEVVMDADLYVATEIDPLFLALPALADSNTSKGAKAKKALFLTTDDHLDKLPMESSHLSEILSWPRTRALVEGRMAVVCDSVDAGDENMLRLNEDKLLAIILEKARQMGHGGLPQSMEDKFVKRALEAPSLIKGPRVAAGETSNRRPTATSPDATTQADPIGSQSSALLQSNAPSSSQPSAVTPSADTDNAIATAIEAPPDVVNLQRLRVAFEFICSTYIPPSLAERLQLLLRASVSVNFSALDEYLAEVTRLRAEAVAAGAFSDFSRKRARDDEEDEARADRKRKLEDEKKRKASESRGVRDLKKVNTSGMKKMSDFFKTK